MSTTFDAQPCPTLTFTLNSAASTNATVVKATPGFIYSGILSNSGAAAAFVKFYNKATAPAVGTDIPVMTMAVPATGHAVVDVNPGFQFTAGIAIAVTNLSTDADATAVIKSVLLGSDIVWTSPESPAHILPFSRVAETGVTVSDCGRRATLTARATGD